MGNEDQENTAKVIQLEDYDRSLGIDELNLAEFPLAALSTRSEPGQNTLLFEDTIFDEGAGTQINRSLVIAGNDHFGLPTSFDSDILLLLIHLSNVRNGLKSKRVEFSRYELIKFLGLPQDGRSYQRLDRSLKKWTSVSLHYKLAWWQRSGQKWRSRSFHILETLELRGKDEIHDDGLSSFTWNDVIFESFGAGNLRRIDLGVYFDLNLAISKQMYRFTDKRFYRSKRLVFELRQFATEHIGLSRRYDIYEIKRKLRPAIRELESIGFLRPMLDAERFTKLGAGKWEIAFEKGQGKFDSTQLQNQELVIELKKRGVNDRAAKDLASKFSNEHIEAKIAIHDELRLTNDKRINRNPAGFLAAAIRFDYLEPKIATKFPRPGKNLATKSKSIVESKSSNGDAAFLAYWNSVPIDEQSRIERDAIASASAFHRDTLRRLEKSDHSLKQATRMQIIRAYLELSKTV